MMPAIKRTYHSRCYTGTEWFKNFEDILNEEYIKGWDFVRIYSLRTSEYTIIFKKVRDKEKIVELCEKILAALTDKK